MKNFLHVLFIILSFNLLANDEVLVTAKPMQVTVFLNQAQISSNIKTTLNAGNNTVIIENIATTIDPNSIQLAGQGDIIILSTKFGQNFTSKPKNSAKVQQLTDSLNLVVDQIRQGQLNLDIYVNEKDLLKANYAVNATTTGTSPEKVKAMADFYRSRMSDVNNNILKFEKQIASGKEKQIKLQNQLKEQNAVKPSIGQILVNIMAKSKTTVNLELNYVAYSAGWQPVYDLRAKDNKSPINLEYKANVWQQTGIDWEQVLLKLSTTNPSLGGNKPELNTQWVDFYQKPVYSPQYKSRSAGAVMEDAAAGAAPIQMNEAMVVTSADMVTVNEGSLAVNFDISIPYTINHGGSPQLVDIHKHELPAHFKYYVAPKLDTDAFLTATLAGWEQYNLLPGQAKVFFEGAYVGETYLNSANTNDSLTIGLGRDKKIIVKREKVADFTSKKTIGTNIKETYGYKITLRNTKKDAISITVEDQIPISQNNDIEVLDRSYAGATINDETGKVSWLANLKPNETKVLELKYSLKYPKGKTIIGGN